jgi:hypothetical protein
VLSFVPLHHVRFYLALRANSRMLYLICCWSSLSSKFIIINYNKMFIVT